MMLSNLKPCPFCGAIPHLNEIPPHKHTIATFMPDYEGGCFVECSCSCAISAKNKEEAIKKWNNRPFLKGDEAILCRLFLDALKVLNPKEGIKIYPSSDCIIIEKVEADND